MEIATAETWYQTKSVGDGITWIWEPHIKPYYRCNIWHIRGRDRDLLIDSGMGVVSLREQVQLLAERPLLAVATHTHFDHVGAHHEFPERAVHLAEAHIMVRPDRYNTVADDYVTDDIFTALPPGDWQAGRYNVQPAPATWLVDEGDRVDLGDRNFEVLHLPGHSPGSIALHETATGILFAGDVIYDGPLAYEVYHTDMADYVRSMRRILDLQVTQVHGGHFDSFGGARMHEIARTFLAEHDR
ncbi:MAG: MBL fold metallo-hydrolase [Rhodospirillaceae bacterium]|nr:MAG: MBL fold metallo-hydrolase [Rhodospirillaceae bacterium]